MGLITKLKSLLGLAEDRPQPRSSESGVTIEREPDESNERPDAETERAIKTADETVDGDDTAATEAEVASGVEDETDPTAHIERVESDSAESNGTEGDASGAEEPETEGAETEGAETEEPTPSEADADARPLEDVKGIGPAYAERLRSAGVEDTAALAEADPEEIAEETDLSPKRIAGWVERAKSL